MCKICSIVYIIFSVLWILLIRSLNIPSLSFVLYGFRHWLYSSTLYIDRHIQLATNMHIFLTDYRITGTFWHLVWTTVSPFVLRSRIRLRHLSGFRRITLNAKVLAQRGHNNSEGFDGQHTKMPLWCHHSAYSGFGGLFLPAWDMLLKKHVAAWLMQLAKLWLAVALTERTIFS